MPRKFRIAYFAHSIRSDWNNGNAHFLRGLMRALGALGHDTTVFEPRDGWSLKNLREEPLGARSLAQFSAVYADLKIAEYGSETLRDATYWRERLRGVDVVIVHEWNPPELAHTLLELRDAAGFRILFHDTHHRASSSPEQIKLFGVARFDGVLAFGEDLSSVYRQRFRIEHVWTLHEAADTTVFHPQAEKPRTADCTWIGNWGEGERSDEIRTFLLSPAAQLRQHDFCVYGVRYPEDGVAALCQAGVEYRGYLPNLEAPRVYSESGFTVHIPRQQYAGVMAGIPTIRVFEALACGIPLISAPWQDTECLFREGDFAWARTCIEMTVMMQTLLANPSLAQAQASRGLETVLARHTCAHRAEQLASIVEEMIP